MRKTWFKYQIFGNCERIYKSKHTDQWKYKEQSKNTEVCEDMIYWGYFSFLIFLAAMKILASYHLHF